MGEEEKVNRLKKGERVTYFAIASNLSLAFLKFLIGFISGSIALLSDAVHTASDSLTAFASWFGLRMSRRKADEKFPYGYYKAESLATLFISLLIIYAGFELIIESYSRLFELPRIEYPLLALFIPILSIISAFLLSRYELRVGREINAQSLIAIGKESRLDIFSSSLVFLAILSSSLNLRYVEGSVGIFISLLIFKVGIENLKDSLFSLMDITPGKEIEEKVKEIITSIAGVEEFEGLKLRRAGPFIFGEVKIKVRKHLDVKRAHEVSDLIEKRVTEEVKDIDSFLIHIEPYETNLVKVAIPIKEDKGMSSEIDERFGKANKFFFGIVNKKRKEVETFYVKENPYKEKSSKAGLATSNFLVKEKIDALITKRVGEISFHTLRDNLIDIYEASGEKVKDLLEDYIAGKLKRLEKPTKVCEEIEEVERVEVKEEERIFPGRGPPTYPRGRRRGPWWRIFK